MISLTLFPQTLSNSRQFFQKTDGPLWGPIICVSYIATAWFGLEFSSVNTFAAPIWAPTGIALAAVLLRGYTIWPWITLAAFAVNIYLGAPLWVALLITGGNTLEVVFGAYLIHRFADATQLFRKLWDTLVFIGTTYLIGIVSATIGVGALWIAGLLPGTEVMVTWLAWRTGDTLGAIIMAPLIITWAGPYVYPVGPLRDHLGETVALVITLFGVNVLNFMRPLGIPGTVPLLYLVSLPLAWAAVRFGPRGVAVATFVNLAIALAATGGGAGPFAAARFEDGLFFLQIYVAVTSMTFLVFASIVKELTSTRDTLEEHIDELEYALRKIRSEDRAKADFLAELAHELRNPLAPVVSALELISAKGLRDAEAQEAVDIIRKQTSTMAQLLNDLLDISRVSKRKVTLNKKVLDLRQVVRNALGTAEPFIQTRKHNIITSLTNKPLWVEGDPLRLEQIVVNLLNNAAKYTDTNGTIRVTARKKEDTVALSVEDNGIGIAKEMLTRIFEPFLQLSSGEAARSAGLGIGLSLTKHLVELHRGSIEALSEGVGKGTEVIVRFPAGEPPPEGEKLPPQTTLGLLSSAFGAHISKKNKPQKRRILIVDDNEKAAQSLGKLIEHRGHKVEMVYEGQSALEIISAFKPHIVILDIGLPEMDGYEVARRLRHTGKPMRLIALTGYGLDEDKQKALAAGFDHHLVKPVSIANLEPLLT